MWIKTAAVSAITTMTAAVQRDIHIILESITDTVSMEDITDKGRSLSMRSEQEVNRAIEQYADTVRRLCMLHLKNYADTEDIFQTVFLKYVLSSVVFENEEHEKAWFIRVTINACRDLLKSFLPQPHACCPCL